MTMDSNMKDAKTLDAKPDIDAPPKKGILRRVFSILWRITRILLFLIAIVPMIFFWWSFLGIIIGFLFYLFSKDPTWKFHGMVLAFVHGFTTLLVEGVSVFYLLAGAGIIFLYCVSASFILFINWLVKMIRKKPLFKWQLVKWFRTLPSKGRKGIKFAAFVAPIVMWSVVSLDFGVMFDNKPQLLWVYAPSTVNIGEEFSIMVQAWDRYERLSGGYGGRVDFSLKSYNLSTFGLINSPLAQLPSPYTFTGKLISLGFIPAYLKNDGKDNGRHVFMGQINTTGIHYILVNDTVTGNTYWSNPILVKNFTTSDQKLYWGDLHSHSLMSDGSGTPEHSFDFARYVACLDFHALTDHGEDLSVYGLTDWGFGIVRAAANNAYDPGEFVTFQGVEWTPHYPPAFSVDFGHYTCIFSGDELPYLGAHVQTSPAALWNMLDEFCSSTGDKALAMPHHTIRLTFIQDWTYVNSTYVKLAEVSSVHGECLFGGYDPRNYRGSVDLPAEPVNGAAIIDAFKMGHRMTLCASGDNHDGHPGHSLSHTDAYIGHQWPFAIDHSRNGHPYPSSLTAAHAVNLTREGVWEALENQRIFANSDYGRPILNFSINGVAVGDGSTVIVATNTTQRNISIFLAQDGAPAPRKATAASVNLNWVPDWNATIEIIKNGVIWNSTAVNGPLSKLELTDSLVINGTSYTGCIESDGNYYINQYSDNPVDPLTLNTGGADFYLVRVVGANGRTTFAGPIWVTT